MNTHYIKYKSLFILFLLFSVFIETDTKAQEILWSLQPTKKVFSSNGALLENTWNSGFNAPQIYTADIQGNESMQTVIFDRQTGLFSVFSQGVYNAALSKLFPKCTDWAYLVDLDLDGDADLVTPMDGGIQVYKNTPIQGRPKFTSWLAPAETIGISGAKIRLQIEVTDVPFFGDVDFDGDIDALFFAPAVGTELEYHQNMSMETLGRADTLMFQKSTRWGEFSECGCDLYEFGASACRIQKPMHAGGTLLAYDPDNDTDMDLWIGDIDCTKTSFLKNGGNAQNAQMEMSEVVLSPSNPYAGTFPAIFEVDWNEDQRKDLVFTPNNAYGIPGPYGQDVFKYYQKTNSAALQYEEKTPPTSFSSLDFGTDRILQFLDWNEDGLKDLMLYSESYEENDPNTISDIRVLQQKSNGDYTLLPTNLFPKTTTYLSAVPTIYDVNADGIEDLIAVVGSQAIRRVVMIEYVRSPGESWADVNLDEARVIPLEGLRFREQIVPYKTDEKGGTWALHAQADGSVDRIYRSPDGDWSTEEADIAGFKPFNGNGQLRMSRGDLNGDGFKEWVMASREGYTWLLTDNFHEETSSVRSQWNLSIGTDVLPFHTGERSSLLVDKGGVWVGYVGGGLEFFSLETTNLPTALYEEKRPSPLRIGPNPAENELYITSSIAGELTLTDVLGTTLRKIQIPRNAQQMIPLKGFPQGIYILTFEVEEGRWSHKIVKK